MQTIAHQDKVMKKRFEEADAFCQATSIDFTDGGRTPDERKQLQASIIQFTETSVAES